MEIHFARMAYPVTTLGPGKRLAIWTAGCSRRCPGCISPDILVAREKHRIPLDELNLRIAQIGDGLEGVTLTGGDPFDQAMPLQELVRSLRILFPHWNFIAYTGHHIDELSRDATKSSALQEIDLLIDGPYREDLPTPHPLIGSANQSFHAQSKEGVNILNRIDATLPDAKHFELATGAEGSALLVGVGTPRSRNAAHRKFNLNPASPATAQENKHIAENSKSAASP